MNLEETLRALEPDWPETPDLAAGVLPRLEPRGATPRRPSFGARRSGLAIAFAGLLLAGTAVAAIPPLREWVDELFGGRVEVREVPRLPRAQPGLRLGPERSLADARRIAGFDVPTPQGFDTFYARDGELSATRRGLLFTAIRGELPFEFVEKMLGAGTTAEQVRVAGGRGIWIEGEPHVVILRRPDGEIGEERLRLAENTLLWPSGRLVLRIEGAPTLAVALRLARTVR